MSDTEKAIRSLVQAIEILARHPVLVGSNDGAAVRRLTSEAWFAVSEPSGASRYSPADHYRDQTRIVGDGDSMLCGFVSVEGRCRRFYDHGGYHELVDLASLCRTRFGGVQCELVDGHDGWHRAESRDWFR